MIDQFHVSEFVINQMMKKFAMTGSYCYLQFCIRVKKIRSLKISIEIHYRILDHSYVEVESLSANTAYKFRLSQCGGTTLYNEFDITTKHDSKFAIKY